MSEARPSSQSWSGSTKDGNKLKLAEVLDEVVEKYSDAGQGGPKC